MGRTFTHKEKLQYSIQNVQRMIHKVDVLGKVTMATKKQLRDIW